jgi:hypothetical protein
MARIRWRRPRVTTCGRVPRACWLAGGSQRPRGASRRYPESAPVLLPRRWRSITASAWRCGRRSAWRGCRSCWPDHAMRPSGLLPPWAVGAAASSGSTRTPTSTPHSRRPAAFFLVCRWPLSPATATGSCGHRWVGARQSRNSWSCWLVCAASPRQRRPAGCRTPPSTPPPGSGATPVRNTPVRRPTVSGVVVFRLLRHRDWRGPYRLCVCAMAGPAPAASHSGDRVRRLMPAGPLAGPPASGAPCALANPDTAAPRPAPHRAW